MADPTKAECWDIAIKVCAGICAFISIWVGWHQHRETLEQEYNLKVKEVDTAIALKTKEVDTTLQLRRDEYNLKKTELNGKFWEARAQQCIAASASAARVAVQHGKDAKIVEEFYVQYWGPLAVLEGRYSKQHTSVEEAMVGYESNLASCLKSPKDDPCWDKLKVCALDIAHECTAMLCTYLNDPEKVDACASSAQPHALSCRKEK